MDTMNFVTTSAKYKHLSFEHYEFIIREDTKHDAFHNGKKRNTGRTKLLCSLASTVGTCVSNIYTIIKDATISIVDSTLVTHQELSASAAFPTVCTKTMYNYVHQGKIHLKPIDLPRILRRKFKRNYKEYIPKYQKGIPISERTFKMDDRSNLDIGEGIW